MQFVDIMGCVRPELITRPRGGEEMLIARLNEDRGSCTNTSQSCHSSKHCPVRPCCRLGAARTCHRFMIIVGIASGTSHTKLKNVQQSLSHPSRVPERSCCVIAVRVDTGHPSFHQLMLHNKTTLSLGSSKHLQRIYRNTFESLSPSSILHSQLKQHTQRRAEHQQKESRALPHIFTEFGMLTRKRKDQENQSGIYLRSAHKHINNQFHFKLLLVAESLIGREVSRQ